MTDFFKKIKYSLPALLIAALILTACGASPGGSSQNGSGGPVSQSPGSSPPSSGGSSSSAKGNRSNDIRVFVPSAPGTAVKENDTTSLDYSNASEGYVSVRYSGTSSKVKIRITGPDSVVYTYDISAGDYVVFPLTGGNGTYTVGLYENIQGTEYSTAFYETIDIAVTNELAPYLYPNQYVYFTESSSCVAKASELVYSANNDLEAINLIYNYIITNITYDYAKAETPPTGYVSDVDAILSSGTGICLDYAAVMATMLRSQGIPTRLEVGYASDAYHAWISIYIEDIGWVNGVVEFTGDTWTLMDPTFGANTKESTLKKFIGDGSNYTLQKIY